MTSAQSRLRRESWRDGGIAGRMFSSQGLSLNSQGLSLNRRLLGGLILSFLVAWGVMVYVWLVAVRAEVLDLHDAQLVQYARLIAGLPAGPEAFVSDGQAPLSLAPRHPYERFIVHQIYSADGELLRASAHAPDLPLGRSSEGFSDHAIDGDVWRVFVLRSDDGRLRVHVAENCEIRNGQISEIVNRTLLPLVLGVPLAALLAWFMVRHSLRPLQVLRERVEGIDRDLALGMDSRDVPPEVAPLVESLRALLERLDLAFVNERRFTADAAHELRTPLATLRAQAQVAQSARGEVERNRALNGLTALVDRASHLVNQMLILAKSEAAGADSQFTEIDLGEIACDVVGDFRSQARGARAGLRAAAPAGTRVYGDRALLMSLMRNLVDNALRYGGADNDVSVRVYRQNHHGIVEVEDRGPGIPESERAQAFERFHRGLGTERSGSGLGLSIAQRVVKLHGGCIELCTASDGRGLLVRARLPALPGPTVG